MVPENVIAVQVELFGSVAHEDQAGNLVTRTWPRQPTDQTEFRQAQHAGFAFIGAETLDQKKRAIRAQVSARNGAAKVEYVQKTYGTTIEVLEHLCIKSTIRRNT